MSLKQPNIFDYVGKKNDEKFTHEKFIVSLLRNPRYKDDIWNNIKQKVNKNEEIIKKSETIEPYAIMEQYYLDKRPADILFLTSEQRLIILELKIYAKDQKSQLWDYYKIAKESSKKKPIALYVTLDGDRPAQESISANDGGGNNLKENSDYFCFRYNELLKDLYAEDNKNNTEDEILELLLFNYVRLINELPRSTKSNDKADVNPAECKSFIKTVKEFIEQKVSACNYDEEKQCTYIDLGDKGKLCLQLIVDAKKINSNKILYGIKNKKRVWYLREYEKIIRFMLLQKKTIIIEKNNRPQDYDKRKNIFGDNLSKKIQLKEVCKNSSDWLFAQIDIYKYLSRYYNGISPEEFAEYFSEWMFHDSLYLR